VTVVVSNRGPYRFVAGDDGGMSARPAPGGLSSSLRPLLTSGAAGPDATWVAAALDDGDRAAVRAGAVDAAGIALHLLDIEPSTFRQFNDVVANQALWFLHHGLFDLPRRPRLGPRFDEAWTAFEEVSGAFADAAAEHAGDGDIVLVQDYQLALVPGLLRRRRPDLRVVHFTHIPFCGPSSARVLPTPVMQSLCTSLAGGPAGFHAARWARAYEASAREILGPDTGVPPTFVSSLGPDRAALEASLAGEEADAATRELDDLVGDRTLLVRVDRIDPSKNIVRGFAAYELLLEQHAEWQGRVVFVAKLNRSRQQLPEYQAYAREVDLAAARVNDRFGTDDWDPVVMDTRDDYVHALVALARSDVLLVNPIRDGLNLVAKEGPLINTRDGVLCLSPGAGAWDELAGAALETHPFDLSQTAAALHRALEMPADERRERAEALRTIAAARTPRDWLEDQLSAAG